MTEKMENTAALYISPGKTFSGKLGLDPVTYASQAGLQSRRHFAGIGNLCQNMPRLILLYLPDAVWHNASHQNRNTAASRKGAGAACHRAVLF